MPRKKIAKEKNQTDGSLSTNIYNIQGEVVEKITLPGQVFAVKANPALITQAVRVYQANQRAGTHATKTRSQVAGSTRKIYRQKGTGRARHGAITAPIFIGGGIAHGPHPRDYALKLPQRMKRLALFGVLTDKLQSGMLKIVRGLEKIEAKTKKMVEVLENLKLIDKKPKNTLLVTSDNLKNIILAGRNLAYLTVRNVRLLNAYEILSHHNLIFMESAIPILGEHFLKEKKEEKKEQEVVKKQVKSKKITTEKPKEKLKRKTTKKAVKVNPPAGGQKGK